MLRRGEVVNNARTLDQDISLIVFAVDEETGVQFPAGPPIFFQIETHSMALPWNVSYQGGDPNDPDSAM